MGTGRKIATNHLDKAKREGKTGHGFEP